MDDYFSFLPVNYAFFHYWVGQNTHLGRDAVRLGENAVRLGMFEGGIQL